MIELDMEIIKELAWMGIIILLLTCVWVLLSDIIKWLWRKLRGL